MEIITRRVRDLASDERRVYESALGHPLHENQQILLQVITPIEEPTPDAPAAQARSPQLPDWCNVYQGLSDQEIAEVESVALDRAGVSGAAPTVLDLFNDALRDHPWSA